MPAIESGVFVMITMNTNQRSFQVNADTATQAATPNAGTQVNRAAVETRVESQAESDAKAEVKREQAGKDAAEEMRKDNAVNAAPDEGIRLEISRQGMEREQSAIRGQDDQGGAQAAATAVAEQDQRTEREDRSDATKERIEEQQKVRERIREQVEQEVDDEEQEVRQTERRTEESEDRQAALQEESEDEAREENITNYAGYTNAQLQQMAANGEISQNDYRTEIENREEKLAERQQQLSDTDEEIARGINRADRAERDMNAINTAFDEESNDNINAQTRAQAIQTLENPQNTQAQQESNQQEQQVRAFARWQNDFGFLIR